ncbi:MAG: sce7725 family protein [Candidatus Manganitrophus sp.]|nr:sce7725 family protein [Candidatus Manganitrophus sp.]
MALKLVEWGFVPIIEPVKENFPALKRALNTLKENNCRFILIANPSVGDMKEDNATLCSEILDGELHEYQNYSVGLNLTATEPLATAQTFLRNIRCQRRLFTMDFLMEKDSPHLLEKKSKLN